MQFIKLIIRSPIAIEAGSSPGGPTKHGGLTTSRNGPIENQGFMK